VFKHSTLHGASIKSKPNWNGLCRIYLMADHMILKLCKYLSLQLKCGVWCQSKSTIHQFKM